MKYFVFAIIGVVIIFFVVKYFINIVTIIAMVAWLWGISSLLGGPGGTPGKITGVALTALMIWGYIIGVRQDRRVADEKRKEKSAIDEQRRRHRDAEWQVTPYVYSIGRHAGETLAIRYGIAHIEPEKGSNTDGNPANTIRLQKIKRIRSAIYEVHLTDYNDRRAKAVLEPGTEYVKTFYPLDEEWFHKYADLEETLKGNSGFSLKDLATFHVEKVILKR